MLHQSVFNTSEICAEYGVKHAVMSPGSRNAPLSISFARNKKIKKWIIPDERAAAFIALGIAQKLKEPVVLCCTSGTALLNYAPAVAEAFYREIPLIILSADRPPELIDQRDGQTIRQFEALKNHVKSSIQLPVVITENTGSSYRSKLATALSESLKLPLGPVHLNIPFREPFYPSENEALDFDNVTKEEAALTKKKAKQPFPFFKKEEKKKILVLIGQKSEDLSLNTELLRIADVVPILVSPLNNVQTNGIHHVDFFLGNQAELKPDILITTGLSVLSKKVKLFLQRNKPAEHFHFDPSGVPVDTYQSSPTFFESDLYDFLNEVNVSSIADKAYFELWRRYSNCAANAISESIPTCEFSETSAFHQVLRILPIDIELHLSNSMPVRFAELFGVKPGIQVWCNRGTSGIDGCTSTALGTSLVSDRLNVLLTGDLSFLYDRNAFFHNHIPNNFRVIVLNNNGGGIFRLIDGPSMLPEHETYFQTPHNRTAEYICQESGLTYLKATGMEELEKSLDRFFDEADTPILLEIFTDPERNKKTFNQLKEYIHEQISR